MEKYSVNGGDMLITIPEVDFQLVCLHLCFFYYYVKIVFVAPDGVTIAAESSNIDNLDYTYSLTRTRQTASTVWEQLSSGSQHSEACVGTSVYQYVFYKAFKCGNI